MTPEKEFIKELRTLCDKHGLYIVHWSGVTRLVPFGFEGEDVLADFEIILEEMGWDEGREDTRQCACALCTMPAENAAPKNEAEK